MLFVWHHKILHKHCLQFLLGVKMAPRETENNAYAKFWGDKQRVLWYVMVFSGVVNSLSLSTLWQCKCKFHCMKFKARTSLLLFKVVRTYLFARWLCFWIGFLAETCQPISMIFGILNKEWLNFNKMLFVLL